MIMPNSRSSNSDEVLEHAVSLSVKKRRKERGERREERGKRKEERGKRKRGEERGIEK